VHGQQITVSDAARRKTPCRIRFDFYYSPMMRTSEVILNTTCNLFIWFLLAGIFVPSVLTAETPRTFQPAIVVSAEKHEPDTSHYNKRTDAPALVTEYDYDVFIRLNCSIYAGRYKSAIDHLPGAFAANQIIAVSLERHVMFVKTPDTGEIKLGIIRHHAVPGSSCGAGRLQHLLPGDPVMGPELVCAVSRG
jgi:hypothetical protein